MTPPEDPAQRPAPSRSGFVIWLLMVFATVVVITAIATAAAVRHALNGGPRLTGAARQAVLFISEFPGHVRAAVEQVRAEATGEPTTLLVQRKLVETPAWKRTFPAPEDSGYLLLAGVDSTARHATVRLLRISDGRQMAIWDPDWNSIHDRTSEKRFSVKGVALNLRASHPLLLADGDIVFTTFQALVRMTACSRQPVWLLDLQTHHSNEIAPDGTLWMPAEAGGGSVFAGNAWLRERVRDDSLAHVSPDGKLLENLSFIRILQDNGLGALALGTTGFVLQPDPLHLNEIKPAFSDGRYWKKDDLLISSRHLSALFLYRPSTGRIVWHRVGPWLNQHSPDFLGDHLISVFDNNVYGAAPREQAFLEKDGVNRVLVYDFDTDQVTEPFKDLLSAQQPRTRTQGLARILPDGGLFVEESNMGRHLRFTKDRLLWSRVNDYDDNRIGHVTWSRYLTAEEAAQPLKALASRACARP